MSKTESPTSPTSHLQDTAPEASQLGNKEASNTISQPATNPFNRGNAIFQGVVAGIGTLLGLIFGIFSILAWQNSNDAQKSADISNKMALFHYCASSVPAIFDNFCHGVNDQACTSLPEIAFEVLGAIPPSASFGQIGPTPTFIPPGATKDHGLSKSEKIGLGVGLGVGFLSIGVGFGIFFHARHRQKRFASHQYM